MPLVTVKDKFQVTIPAKLRERVPLRVGDLLEATVQGDGILLRPKAVVDRAAVAEEMAALLRSAPVASEDEGKPEEAIIEESIADVAAARAWRRRRTE
jgi:AbrB family looped-hinge helix DNA binding protein